MTNIISVSQQSYAFNGMTYAQHNASINLASMFSVSNTQATSLVLSIFDNGIMNASNNYGVLTSSTGVKYSTSSYSLTFNLINGQYVTSTGLTLASYTYNAGTNIGNVQLSAYSATGSLLDSRTVDVIVGDTSVVQAPAATSGATIAAKAQSFIGKSWHINNAWGLAAAIDAYCGVTLGTTKTTSNNGNVQVAYNAANGVNANWQANLQIGDQIYTAFTAKNGGGSDIATVDRIVNGVVYVVRVGGPLVADGSGVNYLINETKLSSYSSWVDNSSVIVYRVAASTQPDFVQTIVSTQINTLTTTQIAALNSSQVSNLTTTQLGQLNVTQVASLTTTELGLLTTTQMVSLNTTDIRGLTSTQMVGLTTTQINKLSVSQTSAFTATELNQLTATQFVSLSTQSIQGLTTTQMVGLATTKVGQLTSSQIYSLTTTQFSLMTTTEISGLTSTQMAGIYTLEMSILSSTQIGSLTNTQISSFSTSQFTALTSTSIGLLTSKQVGGLSVADLSVMTTLQEAGLKSTQLNGMSSTQIGALTSVVVSKFTTTQFAVLGSTQVSGLTTSDIKALGSTQIDALSSSALAGFKSSTQLAVLTSSQVAGLTHAQAVAFTTTQLAMMTSAATGYANVGVFVHSK